MNTDFNVTALLFSLCGGNLGKISILHASYIYLVLNYYGCCYQHLIFNFFFIRDLLKNL